MKFCGNCGRQLADDALFCDACGTRSAAQPAPSVANVEPINSQPVAYPVQPQPFSSDQAAPSGVKEKKKKSTKTLVIVLVVALILAAAAGAVWWLLGRGASDPSSLASAEPYTDYVLYVKDNGLYYVDLNELESQYIFSYDGAETASFSYLEGYNESLLYGYIGISRNGKAMVYENDEDGQRGLYYRTLTNPTEEIEIEALEKYVYIVGTPFISDDGRIVTYYKNEFNEKTCQTTHGIYQFDGKESKKIISPQFEVMSIQVSPDGKQVFYGVLTDPDLLSFVTDPEILEQSGSYWWKDGEGVEKIGDHRYQVAISPDASTVCYIPDATQDDAGTLYRKKFGEEPEILARNVSRIERQYAYELGTWYSEDLSTVYYTGADGHLYKVDADGATKQVDAIEYLYPKDDRSGWPEITFIEESSNDWINYGALYMDGELVDKDTSRNDLWGFFMPEYLPESRSLIYFRDAFCELYSTTIKQGATMMLYNGKESVQISKNVCDYQVLHDGSILYWCQVDSDKYEYQVHDLYYFDGEESHLIARDAEGFLSVWKTPAYRPVLD